MAADQQFCLKWNNHTTTLVSVFDTLLEKESLVDCTLAAEGQFIKAHKVVLSACSPYFELLLSQHYDKHPIVVLKDVQFYELRAILDYMYRGEVNISQDQLASLLKVAESLQIKGLSGNENDGPPEKKQENRKSVSRPLPSGHSEPKKTAVNNLSGPSETPPLTPKPIVRDDRMSPVPRKRKKRPNSLSDDSSSSALQDGLEVSSSNELPSHSQPVPSVSNLNIPPAFTNVPVSTKPKTMTPVTTPVKERAEPEFRPSPQTSRYNTPTKSAPPAVPIETVVVPKLEKLEPPTDTLIEPKAEIIDEKEDDIEDLTLDDDEEYDMEAGPSNAGDESNQDYGWSQEDAMLAAQQAGGNQRDSQAHVQSSDVRIQERKKSRKQKAPMKCNNGIPEAKSESTEYGLIRIKDMTELCYTETRKKPVFMKKSNKPNKNAKPASQPKRRARKTTTKQKQQKRSNVSNKRAIRKSERVVKVKPEHVKSRTDDMEHVAYQEFKGSVPDMTQATYNDENTRKKPSPLCPLCFQTFSKMEYLTYHLKVYHSNQ